jgi:hypothetical protein
MRYRPLLAAVTLIGMSQDALPAREPRRLELKWSELGSRIAGRKVALALPDGTRIEGKALRVDPDGLRLKVTKTSDRKVQPKGEHMVPRQSLSVLRVTEYRKAGRLVGVLTPFAAAAAVTAPLMSERFQTPPGVIFIPVLAAAGVSIAGYYIGKALDKRVTEIKIAREE